MNADNFKALPAGPWLGLDFTATFIGVYRRLRIVFKTVAKPRWIATLLCALCALPAGAQNWPTKPVRFITAFPVGGSSDQVARIVSERLTAVLGQQIIVDNRTGGNGVAGTALAAGAAPDGYNFLVVFDSHATNPSLQKNIPYDTLKAFTPVMMLASSPYGLVVQPASPYKTLADLIAAAKARPGELTLGSSGVGSRGHLAMALLEQRAGFKITQVPYRGPPQAMTDVIGGQITMQMGTFLFVSPFIKSQRVRGLAVTSATRMAQLPDIPTVAEQGFPGYEVHSWWGVVAPVGVPQAILQKLHAALRDVLSQTETRNRLEQLGATVRASTPDEFANYIAREMALWGKVVRDSRISATE
jgi:tripartite-type tricarboxylate transporter receptor subunit TctC